MSISLSQCCFTGLLAEILMAGEEVKDSAIVVPRSMVIALVVSGAQTMAISIAILYGIGDINTALESPTNFPIIQIFLTATGSKAATTALICALISTLIFGTFGALACASRLAWAFARAKGFPFPIYFSHVSAIVCNDFVHTVDTDYLRPVGG